MNGFADRVTRQSANRPRNSKDQTFAYNGYHALRNDVGLVAAKGFDPLRPTARIVISEGIAHALRQIA
jgi:hypothetical protein